MKFIRVPDYNFTCISNEFRMKNENTESSTSDMVFKTNLFTEPR